MGEKVWILEDPQLSGFLCTATEMLKPDNVLALSGRCHHCGGVMRFPLMVRQCDLDAFQSLLEIADKYLNERGATPKMLGEILERIKDRLNFQ